MDDKKQKVLAAIERSAAVGFNLVLTQDDCITVQGILAEMVIKYAMLFEDYERLEKKHNKLKEKRR